MLVVVFVVATIHDSGRLSHCCLQSLGTTTWYLCCFGVGVHAAAVVFVLITGARRRSAADEAEGVVGKAEGASHVVDVGICKRAREQERLVAVRRGRRKWSAR